MGKLIKKSILTTSIFLILVLLFLSIFIYNPLYNTLEETLLDNFQAFTETTEASFNYIIQRGIENTRSISSRTMLKEEIIKYKKGLIDLEELKYFTQAKYEDGFNAMDNAIYGIRLVDNDIIASCGERPASVKIEAPKDYLYYEIIKDKKNLYLLINMPLKSNGIIGEDIIVFDLYNSIGEITLENMTISVIEEDELDKYKEIATRNPAIFEYEDDELIYLNTFFEIYDGKHLHISILKDELFYRFDSITKSSAINMSIVFIFSFFYINIVIISFAKKRISHLDKSNKKHKEESHYDSLTGAYTRSYLDYWLIKNAKNDINYSLVFTDMNKFKAINDKYGHKKGDEVLRAVVLTMKSEIRKKDVVIRFGGDEFLILLEDINKDIAIQIVERINRALDREIQLDLEVSFAYGIVELNNIDEFSEALEEADKKMYEMKRSLKKV